MAIVYNTEIAPKVRTFCVRGINVAAIDVATATDLIEQLATDARGVYVTVTGAHGIVESVYDGRVLEAHQRASLVVPDGVPLVWLGRLIGYSSIGRVYGSLGPNVKHLFTK